ncbi:MAG: ferrous iron transport protein B [Oligosphaeraceae bacterium]|nr:ferrous iron transport protein B [Oligosphaeraceae bacterium]
MKKSFVVALAGNPNCGKTSIFNQLTGTRQHVGNYPGVTVERKAGFLELDGLHIELIDLPGIYSLSSTSPEEKVAFRELISANVDLIINVVDASIPQRNLYLTTQLAELDRPMIIAFNMSDEAEKKGLSFDYAELEKTFGAKIVNTVGTRQSGIAELKKAIPQLLLEPPQTSPTTARFCYHQKIDEAISTVSALIADAHPEAYRHVPARFFAIKLLEKDVSAMRMPELQQFLPAVEEQLAKLDNRGLLLPETFMADCRYALISGACRRGIRTSRVRRWEISDRIDSVVTNKILGLPIFLLVLYITFWLTFRCAEPLTAGIEFAMTKLCFLLGKIWPDTFLPFMKELLIDGVIGGVGEVIIFLPNITLLFLGISFLEDSGYMARAAFVTDGIMRKFGLHGKSFVPLVLGFGCTVPAIMATRGIESEKDRITTILVLPLMSCSARLPIYALFIPAFFPSARHASIMLTIYLIGVFFAMAGAWLMKHTLFRGDQEVYLMELPPYRLPTLKSIFLNMWDRSLQYLQKAGSVILAAAVILFITNTFPKKQHFEKDYEQTSATLKAELGLSPKQIDLFKQSGLLRKNAEAFLDAKGYLPGSELERLEALLLSNEQKQALQAAKQLADAMQKVEFEQQAEAMAYTISGRVGKFMEPFFRPVGFDWRICTALVGSMAAREVFVSQLGILFSVGTDAGGGVPLRRHLANTYTPLQGFCTMLFCLLSIPCLATLVIIRKELNSWYYAIADALALFALAYIATMIVYQGGLLLQIGTQMIG